MKTSSAKAKGRLACLQIKELLHSWAPDLGDDDIRVTSSGANGEDLVLSPAARKLFPFTIEAKNQEAISIWASIYQSQAHAKGTEHMPLLCFRRNRSEMMACLRLEDLLKLIR